MPRYEQRAMGRATVELGTQLGHHVNSMGPPSDRFDELVAAYPRILERGLKVRLGKVLDDAYGFRISKKAEALDTLDTKIAQDAIEVLLAALEIASGVGESDTPRRPSRIQSLKPKGK
jgi:hypothetical protein